MFPDRSFTDWSWSVRSLSSSLFASWADTSTSETLPSKAIRDCLWASSRIRRSRTSACSWPNSCCSWSCAAAYAFCRLCASPALMASWSEKAWELASTSCSSSTLLCFRPVMSAHTSAILACRSEICLCISCCTVAVLRLNSARSALLEAMPLRMMPISAIICCSEELLRERISWSHWAKASTVTSRSWASGARGAGGLSGRPRTASCPAAPMAHPGGRPESARAMPTPQVLRPGAEVGPSGRSADALGARAEMA
mmetsp:Transcript_45693/g.130990  ORF Transcript_45693/g.130990 Transcript_45693/m.130990 type:complete len:255 (-) Transcript_45693:7-771(-)